MEITLDAIKSFIKTIKDDSNFKLSKEITETPFNIILSSSDFYYRENFHSDVISSILKKNVVFLEKFISFIQKEFKAKKYIDLKISPENYTKYTVEREFKRIDILIRNNQSKHCIIIENKINGASDMPRQIPRYVKAMQDEGFNVDVVIYLSLDGNKQIDIFTWSEEDKERLKSVPIIEIAAASHNTGSFCTDFLTSILTECNCTVQEFTFTQQYKDLLEFIRRNEMNDSVMEKFYELMVDENSSNFDVASDIVTMVNNMPSYRLKHFYQLFQENKKPFDKIYKWDSACGLIFENCKTFTDYNIKFEVYSRNDKTEIIFKIQEDIEDSFIEETLKNMGMANIFTPNDNANNFYKKEFDFPSEEKDTIKFVSDFLTKFQKLIEKNDAK